MPTFGVYCLLDIFNVLETAFTQAFFIDKIPVASASGNQDWKAIGIAQKKVFDDVTTEKGGRPGLTCSNDDRFPSGGR